ncbi:MAG: hypothetical protein PVJ52_03455 [Candidatus Woesebacteria bacterium]|jgi:hypothetical protein
MNSKIKQALFVIFLALIPTLLIWLPFFFNLETIWGIPLPQEGMSTVVANYDGPLHIVIAKTFYNTDIIRTNYSFPLPLEYYAAHFPLFPLLIRVLGPILTFPYSMLFMTITATALALHFFQKLILDFVDKKHVAWITAVFAVFPARWLIVRSVGSSEPLFIASIIASIYYFREKKYAHAGVWGALAQLTKSPGILLFVAYTLVIFVNAFKKSAHSSFSKFLGYIDIKKRYPLLLIPGALVAIFYLYQIKFDDFFAYFNSGDNIHLFFPPFQVFNYAQPWVNTFWLEEILFIYLFGTLGLLKLIEMKEYEIAWFTGIFFASILFVSHRDVLRYALPVIPFLFVAFSKTLVKKEFKIAMAVLVIPIYLYSVVYISQNVMPVSDWAPLL